MTAGDYKYSHNEPSSAAQLQTTAQSWKFFEEPVSSDGTVLQLQGRRFFMKGSNGKSA